MHRYDTLSGCWYPRPRLTSTSMSACARSPLRFTDDPPEIWPVMCDAQDETDVNGPSPSRFSFGSRENLTVQFPFVHRGQVSKWGRSQTSRRISLELSKTLIRTAFISKTSEARSCAERYGLVKFLSYTRKRRSNGPRSLRVSSLDSAWFRRAVLSPRDPVSRATRECHCQHDGERDV